MSNLAAIPGWYALSVPVRWTAAGQRLRQAPQNETAASVLEQPWQRVEPRCGWMMAAASETRIDSVHSRLAVRYPASAQAPLRVLSGAQRHSVFCFAFRAPLGLRLSQNKLENCDTEHRTSFFRAPPQKQTFGTWEPGPFAYWCPEQIGRLQHTETATMYKNTVNLIGFLGNDATIHTGSNRSFTTLSLATKSSYKDKKSGEYVSQTEWHSLVVFGKIATFAGSLKKGAHIEVEGELRSREYTSKKTKSTLKVWEIRVKSILKLDRAEQAVADEAEFEEHEEFSPEDTAA